MTDTSTELLATEKYAFEPFSSLDGVLRGEPVKIMPLGIFYRNERKLEITEVDLNEIARNFQANLPRFRVPINENHSGLGKIGTVRGVTYRKDGPDGIGLYATLDLTDEGKELLKKGRYDAVSPEMIWKKNNGATYQDPETGKQYSNVLVGLALTDRPFFSHEQVALFSEVMMDHETGYSTHRLLDAVQIVSEMGDDLHDVEGVGDELATAKNSLKQALSKILALFSAGDRATDDYREFTTEQREALAKKGAALADGSFPIQTVEDLKNAIKAFGRGGNKATVKKHIIKRARALDRTDLLPADWEGSTKEEKGEMSDQTNLQGESFAVTADEFAALKAKAEKAGVLEAQVSDLKLQADTFAEQLLKEKRTRRLDQLKVRCERFMALAVKPDELAEKFAALEEVNAELFGYFEALLETTDRALIEAGLFSEVSSARTSGRQAESFSEFVEQVLAEKFGGDRARYSEAMHVASKTKPELAEEYLNSAPTRRRSIAR